MQKTYNKTNFHKHTFCIYKEVFAAEVNGLKLGYTSKSGSSYYFTDNGLYRVSNHWGRAANCRWRLLPLSLDSASRMKVGYANWTDFYPNNEHENLFYIEVDFDAKEVSFQHKASPKYDGKSQIRNAAETARVIRQINEVITTENWAKYLKFDSINDLRKEVIERLITTNLTFLEIKRKIGELYGTT